MTGLDLLLAVAGAAVTLMVVVGMILITPRGQVEARPDADVTPGTEPVVPAVTSHPHEGRFVAEPARTMQPQEVEVDGPAITLKGGSARTPAVQEP